MSLAAFHAFLLLASAPTPAAVSTTLASAPAATAAPAQAAEAGIAPTARIAEIMARADGSSPDRAYEVASVSDEYAIVRALGLQVRSQSLVMRGKKPYDVLEVRDPRGGKVHELWFDIGRFFGKF